LLGSPDGRILVAAEKYTKLWTEVHLEPVNLPTADCYNQQVAAIGREVVALLTAGLQEPFTSALRGLVDNEVIQWDPRGRTAWIGLAEVLDARRALIGGVDGGQATAPALQAIKTIAVPMSLCPGRGRYNYCVLSEATIVPHGDYVEGGGMPPVRLIALECFRIKQLGKDGLRMYGYMNAPYNEQGEAIGPGTSLPQDDHKALIQRALLHYNQTQGTAQPFDMVGAEDVFVRDFPHLSLSQPVTE